MTIRVNGLFVYPVKSCRGVRVESARLVERGFEHDREWMIVDAATGMFLTQRELPRMALIGVAVGEDGLRLTLPGAGEIRVPLDAGGAEIATTVWVSKCAALDCGDDAADAITRFLRPEKPCRLVRMKPDDPRRTMDGKSPVAFADAWPVLAIAEESLADLNSRLAAPLAMDRFRPNITFTGCAPYAEDEWKGFEVTEAGAVEGAEAAAAFAGAFPCIRCAITTVDQATGETGKEPLATLATYRKSGFKVIFGKYFRHTGPGRLACGDEVRVSG